MEPTQQLPQPLVQTARSLLLGASALTAAVALLTGPAAAANGDRAPATAAQLAQAGEPVAFAIEAQALESALAAFEQATGIELSYDPQAVQGLATDGVQGNLTPDAALERLLAGTNLRHRLADGNTATIRQAGGGAQLEALEVEGTAESAYGPVEGYKAERSATATRTDTPIENVPGSVHVVPRDIIEDQAATELGEVVRNVSSVNPGNPFGGSKDTFNIRGFDQEVKLRNGFRADIGIAGQRNQEMAHVERVEVLKGPASVLHGRLAPGGVVNIVTKKPTPEPQHEATLRGGSFGFVEQALDLGGPLTADGSVSYRFNSLYSQKEGFRHDFDTDHERLFLSPVVGVELGEATDLTVELSYRDAKKPFDRGLIADEDGVIDIPVTRNLQSPTDFQEAEDIFASATLEHRFNDSFKTRNRIQVYRQDFFNLENVPFPLNNDIAPGDEVGRYIASNGQLTHSVSAQSELHGDITAFGVEHQLLAAVDFGRDVEDRKNRSTNSASAFDGSADGNIDNDIDPFNPNDNFRPRTRHELDFLNVDEVDTTEQVGLLLQDKLTVTPKWHALIGGRFDYVDINNKDKLNDSLDNRHDSAFSPRLGLVYKPVEELSLYGSYSRSFQPNTGTDANGNIIDPEHGDQVEVGAKRELLGGDLRLTTAAFAIVKSNIAKADPNAAPNSNAQIAGGEERSRGFEVDISGQVTDNLSVIGSYSYIDSEILDADNNEGNERIFVPRHAGSLWGNYEVTQGSLDGLTLGAGAFAKDERQGDAANSFQLPAYVQVDTRLGYSLGPWDAELNVKNVFNTDDNFKAVNFGRVGIVPGQPRTVIASLSATF